MRQPPREGPKRGQKRVEGTREEGKITLGGLRDGEEGPIQTHEGDFVPYQMQGDRGHRDVELP